MIFVLDLVRRNENLKKVRLIIMRLGDIDNARGICELKVRVYGLGGWSPQTYAPYERALSMSLCLKRLR